jgi:hypothetical protein
MVADIAMPANLARTLKLLDGGMMLYWSISAIGCLGLISLPQEFMYAGYGTPMIDAWNWSFAPLDLVFSILGLLSIWLAKNGNPHWKPIAIISLALTFCAGLMAISFWALTSYFDISWWLANLALMGVAIWWLPKIMMAR